MNRRGFLKSGVAGTIAGGLSRFSGTISPPIPRHAETKPGPRNAGTTKYSLQDERARLLNVALCERAIQACMRKHLITAYLPGQCTYNLGEYPARKRWEVSDWDARELDRLKTAGISLIQLHEEWNDSQRLFGADKYSPLNSDGFRCFLDMAHQRRMKVIVYVSSGFFERRDPRFRPEWARDQDLVELFYQYARCSPASPGWRTFIREQFVRIMDDYGVDGIYNDLGYVPLAGNPHAPTEDEVLAFPEDSQRDGSLGDLLALLYEDVKKRNGIVKIHLGATARPLTDLKVYDYLWVGEEVESSDSLRAAVRNYLPYVVPCLDMSRARIASEDELYLQSIPYMQFPLLLAGKPFTGERGQTEGIQYVPESEDFWTRHCREIWKYYKSHPNGPYSYGWWDSVPGRPEARKTHAKWLGQYQPLVEDGTWAWLEVDKTSLIRSRLPDDVVASVFANRRLYLVLANYGVKTAAIETAHNFVSGETPQERGRTSWELPARSMLILKSHSEACA